MRKCQHADRNAKNTTSHKPSKAPPFELSKLLALSLSLHRPGCCEDGEAASIAFGILRQRECDSPSTTATSSGEVGLVH